MASYRMFIIKRVIVSAARRIVRKLKQIFCHHKLETVISWSYSGMKCTKCHKLDVYPHGTFEIKK